MAFWLSPSPFPPTCGKFQGLAICFILVFGRLLWWSGLELQNVSNRVWWITIVFLSLNFSLTNTLSLKFPSWWPPVYSLSPHISRGRHVAYAWLIKTSSAIGHSNSWNIEHVAQTRWGRSEFFLKLLVKKLIFSCCTLFMRRYKVCGCFSHITRGTGNQHGRGNDERDRKSILVTLLLAPDQAVPEARISLGCFFTVWPDEGSFCLGQFGWNFCLYLHMVEVSSNVHSKEKSIQEEHECIPNIWRMLGRRTTWIFCASPKDLTRFSG